MGFITIKVFEFCCYLSCHKLGFKFRPNVSFEFGDHFFYCVKSYLVKKFFVTKKAWVPIVTNVTSVATVTTVSTITTLITVANINTITTFTRVGR